MKKENLFICIKAIIMTVLIFLSFCGIAYIMNGVMEYGWEEFIHQPMFKFRG